MATDHHKVILRVLELLRHNANDQGWVQVSNRAIAETLVCSEGGVSVALRSLQDEGRLKRGDRTNSGTWYRVMTDTLPASQRSDGPTKRLRAAPAVAAPDIVTQLERLAELHRTGALDDDEFREFKQALRAQHQRG